MARKSSFEVTMDADAVRLATSYKPPTTTAPLVDKAT